MRTVSRPGLPGIRRLVATALVAAGLTGCATPPPADNPEAVAEFRQLNDPLEPTNRFAYLINGALDTVALRPAAVAWRRVLPASVRNGLHNVLDNLGGPVRLTNAALEAKPRRAGDILMRFLINTTAGVAGFFDVAAELGHPAHDADFGLTLGNWGVPEGPFLHLPIITSSNPRDAVGFGVDLALDPFSWIGTGTTGFVVGFWSRQGINAIDTRERFLDELDRVAANALDPYATFRSRYRQYRGYQLQKLRADNETTIPIWWPEAAKAQAKNHSRDQTSHP